MRPEENQNLPENLLNGNQRFRGRFLIRILALSWAGILFSLLLFFLLQAMVPNLLLRLGLCALGGFSVSFVLAWKAAAPFRDLEAFASRIASGDLAARVNIRTGDERETLGAAFNQMAEALQKARSELGLRVAERTAELQKSNNLLKREIVERRRVEEARARLEEQLLQAQKMEAIGQLTSGIAHNFNNMLVVVTGNLELVLMDAPEPVRDPIQRALASAERAAAMIKELMLFSRKAELARELLDLNHVTDEAVSICQKTFDRKIDITVESPPGLSAVEGDEVQLQQVLLNLLINARDALEAKPADGTPLQIRVKLSQEEAAQEVEYAGPDAFIRIDVADNGVGMDVETLQHVFEPFFTTKEVGRGTGLGLATVYGIVQQHGGRVEVRSEPGAGATFTVWLPATGSPAGGRTWKAGLQSLPGGTETLLVVDDETEVRNLLAALLARKGYTVLLAASGPQALEIFHRDRDRIALVLLDLSMPGMPGNEVLEKLHGLDPKGRVLIVTGYPAGDDRVPTSVPVIRKPFHQDELLQTVRALLDDQ